jgi:hypothetical protein
MPALGWYEEDEDRPEYVDPDNAWDDLMQGAEAGD